MSLVTDPFKIYNYGNEELRQRTDILFLRENQEQDFLKLKVEYTGKGFDDPEFPHNDNSIRSGSKKFPKKFEKYCESKGWDGKKVEWGRIQDLIKQETFVKHQDLKSGKPIFCSKSLDPNKRLSESLFRVNYDDTTIGDCWFISSLCVVGLKTEDINFIVPIDNYLDEANNVSGIYHFRYWYQGCWLDVVVDDFVPFLRLKDGIILLGADVIENGDDVEFWVVLAAKAFAKLVGNFKRLLSGSPRYSAYEFLTGGFCQTVHLDPSIKPETDKGLWEDLRYCFGSSNPNIIISLTCSMEKKGFTVEDMDDFGLQNEYSYAVVNVAIINNFKIVKLRNSVENKQLQSEQRFDKDDIGGSFWSEVPDEQIQRAGLKPLQPGEFLMSYRDLLKCFYKLNICSQLLYYKPLLGAFNFNLDFYEGEFGFLKPAFHIKVGKADFNMVTIGLTLKAPIDNVPEFPIDVKIFPAQNYIPTKSVSEPTILEKIVETRSEVLESAYEFLCCRCPDEDACEGKLYGLVPKEGSRYQIQQGNKSISFLFTDLLPGKYIVAPVFLNRGAFNQKFVLKIFYPKG